MPSTNPSTPAPTTVYTILLTTLSPAPVNTAGLAPRVFVPMAITVALPGMEKGAGDSEGMAMEGTTISADGTGISMEGAARVAMGEGTKVVRTSCRALVCVQKRRWREGRGELRGMGKIGGEHTGPKLATAVAATVPWCTSVMKLVCVEICSTASVAASCDMTTICGITTTAGVA